MSKLLPRWAMGDPAEVHERLEGIRRRQAQKEPRGIESLFREATMTQDESAQIEDLLMDWYSWAKAYRPALGGPRVSAYCRGARAGDVHSDTDEVDARLAAVKAEQVDVCLNELSWQHRAAVGIHTANREARQQVYRNPRMNGQQQHEAYQQAKLALLPKLRRRGLIVASGENATEGVATPARA